MTAHVPRGRFEQYLRYVEADDANGARTTALQMLWDGMPLEHVVDRILVPTQEVVGERWASGSWSTGQERAATRISLATLRVLDHLSRERVAAQSGHIVVCCAEGERHALPAKVVAAVAHVGGARVTTLGPRLRPAEVEEALAGLHVDLLTLSCTAPANLMGAMRRVQVAHRLGIPVLVGGRAFGRDALRAHAIGADSWAARPSRLLQRPFPGLAGRTIDVPLEAVQLDAVDDATIETARAAAAPRFPAPRPGAVATVALADNLLALARCTAAAMLTCDITILDEEMAWLSGLAGSSPQVAVAAAGALAETIEPRQPVAALMLRSSAQRLADRPGQGPA